MHTLFKIPRSLQNTIPRITTATTAPQLITIPCFFHSLADDVSTKLLETYIHNQSSNPARVLQAGRALHSHLIVTGIAIFPSIASKLLSFYAKYEEIPEARHVFDEIPERHLPHWAAFIGACSRGGYYKEALDVFFEMRRAGFGPDRFVVPSLLRACAQLGDHRTGGYVHGVILRWCLEDDAFVNCGLVDMYSKFGRVQKACLVFDMMGEKDLAVFNAMVSGYAQNGFSNKAFELVESMKTKWGVKPDVVTWNSLLAGFSLEGHKSMVAKIFELMREDGIEPDVTSWTCIISGYVQNFRNEDAFRTFKEMLSSGVNPNSTTISSLLPACATLANVRRGKEIHGYAVVIGVERDKFVSSSLVDMYAKCGFITEAKALFHNMPEQSTVSWNLMVIGLANHGYCDEAIDTFLQMEKKAAERINHLNSQQL